MELTEVRIKMRAFPYYRDVEDPVTGQEVRQEYVARRNDVVKLSELDYQRAQRFGAFYADEDGNPIVAEESVETPPEETPPIDPDEPEVTEPATPDAIDLLVEPVEAVGEWLQSTPRPTVPQVLAQVREEDEEDQPVAAQKVLDAENLVTGQQPRSSLVSELERITNQESEPDDEREAPDEPEAPGEPGSESSSGSDDDADGASDDEGDGSGS